MDYLNKLVTVFLVFLMLVLAPLVLSYKNGEMMTNRLVLNEVVQFIDKVTDKGSITQADLDDLYLGVNATGGVYKVDVKRYIRVASELEGEIRTMYFSNDDLSVLNTGDVVRVSVEEIGIPPGKRLIWALLRIDTGKLEFSLAGTAR